MTELKLSNATGRLILLEGEVGLLRQNSLEVDQLEESAKQISEQAKVKAEEAQKVHTLTHTHTPQHRQQCIRSECKRSPLVARRSLTWI